MRKLRPTAKYGKCFVSYRIEVFTSSLDRLATQGFSSTATPVPSLKSAIAGPSQINPDTTGHGSGGPAVVAQSCVLWVLGPILASALPHMVEGYIARKGPLVTDVSPELVCI